MSSLDPESREIVGDLLRGAIPVSPTPQSSYVTREEFEKTISLVEEKIKSGIGGVKLWVLTGVISIIVSTVGGYVALVSKIDRLNDAMPEIARVQDGRRNWIQRQDQRDGRQDAALQKLDPTYQPLPYEVPPL